MLRTINPRTGRPFEARASDILINDFGEKNAAIPENIQRLLDKAAALPGKSGPHASGVSWRDVLTPKRVISSDAAQVLNTTTETIMVPDYTFAADTLEPGDCYKYTIFFDMSMVAAANNVTFRLKWGGAAGVTLAASGAIAPDPTAVSTDAVGMIEWYFVCRTAGAAGTAYAFGRVELGNDHDDASVAALVGNLNMRMAPQTSAAAVSIDTTTAKALSPTVQFSASTATTQLTALLAILESLN